MRQAALSKLPGQAGQGSPSLSRILSLGGFSKAITEMEANVSNMISVFVGTFVKSLPCFCRSICQLISRSSPI